MSSRIYSDKWCNPSWSWRGCYKTRQWKGWTNESNGWVPGIIVTSDVTLLELDEVVTKQDIEKNGLMNEVEKFLE